MAGSFRDLVAWQKAMALAAEVYRITDDFPQREIYGLTKQVRDAVVSVPSNIAEGKGRQTKRDYVQFLYRARGSLYETQTQLELSRDLQMLSDELFLRVEMRAIETGRVLNGLIASVQRQITQPLELKA
ncbi:MAG TPA: four helix bundle protein [Thermoanaerobaculia bacterium]|nr:four helix bundle protein [Thermoanaerobaculia bacterium]